MWWGPGTKKKVGSIALHYVSSIVVKVPVIGFTCQCLGCWPALEPNTLATSPYHSEPVMMLGFAIAESSYIGLAFT